MATPEQVAKYGLIQSTAPDPSYNFKRAPIAQAVTGAGSNFIGSPAAGEAFAGGEYIPNAVWKAASLPAVIGMGYNALTGQESDPTNPIYAPLNYNASGFDEIHRVTGIPKPRSTADSIMNVGGELLSLPIGAGREAFTAATSKLPKVAEKLANISGAVMAPGLQSRTVKGGLAEIGAVSGLVDTITEATDPNYQSAFWNADHTQALTEAIDTNWQVNSNSLPLDNRPAPTQIPARVELVDKVDSSGRPIIDPTTLFDVNPVTIKQPVDLPPNDLPTLERRAEFSNPDSEYQQGLSDQETRIMHGEVREEGGTEWSAGEIALMTGAMVAAGVASTAGASRLRYMSRINKMRDASEVAAPLNPRDAAINAPLRGLIRSRRLQKKLGINDPNGRPPSPVVSKSREQIASFQPAEDGLMTRMDIFKAQVEHTFSPINDWVERDIKNGIITPEQGNVIKNDLALSLDVRPIAIKVKSFWESNALPLGNKSFTARYQGKSAQEIQRVRAGMSPEEQQAASEIAVIETRLDDLDNFANEAKVPSKAELTKMGHTAESWKTQVLPMKSQWGGYTAEGLRDQAKQLRAKFPQAASSVDDLQGWFKQFPDYFVQTGRMSEKKAAELLRRNPNYVPLEGHGTELNALDNLNARGDVTKMQSLQPNQIKDPFLQMSDYSINAIKSSEQNAARANILDSLAERSRTGGFRTKQSGKAGVYELDSAPQAPAKKIVNGVETTEEDLRNKTVTVHTSKDGVSSRKHFVVNDPHLRRILETNPEFADSYDTAWGKLMPKISNISKQFITGKWNPAFAPTAAGYDVFATMATKKPNFSIGVASKYMKNLSVDPSAIFNPMSGTIQGLYSDTTNLMARTMANDLAKNGFLTKTMGSKRATMVHGVVEEAFRNSTKNLYEHGGVGSAPLYASTQEALPASMKLSSPELYGQFTPKSQIMGSHLGRLYSAVLDNIHSSNRIAVFGHNVDRNLTRSLIQKVNPQTGEKVDIPIFQRAPAEGQDYERIARLTRQAGGDLGQKGGIPDTAFASGFRKYLEMTNYSNVAIQSFAALGRAMANNPTATFGTITAYNTAVLAHIYNNILENPDARDEFLSESPSQRSRAVTFYDENGKVEFKQGIPNEIRAITSPLIEAMLFSTGYTTPVGSQGSALGKASWDGFYKDALWEIMPQVGRAAAMVLTGGLPENSPVFNWVGRPKYYDDPLDTNTTEANIMSTAKGLTDTLTSSIGNSVLEGAYALYKNFDEEGRISGDDFADIITSHVTAPFRTEGKPTSLLWDSDVRLKNQRSTDKPEFTYSYEAVAAAKDWLSDWKRGAELIQFNSNSPGNRVGTRDFRLAEAQDPESASMIASQIKMMVEEINFNQIPKMLSNATANIANAKEGGSAFKTKDSKMEQINSAVIQKEAAITEQLAIVRRYENQINLWLRENGRPEGFSFVDAGHRVDRKGNSPVVPVPTAPKDDPFLQPSK